MKKSILLAIVGLAGGVASSYAQGYVALDNYSSTLHPLITYGPSTGGTLGAGIGAGFTVGLYFAPGTISAASDPSGAANPTSLNALFALGTGNGSSAASFTSAFGTAGEFLSTELFQADPVNSGTTFTFMIVAFNGANFDASTIRGHSAAFTMTTAAGTSPTPNYIGDFMQTFQVVNAVPEPSTFALLGLGTGALLFFRRRK